MQSFYHNKQCFFLHQAFEDSDRCLDAEQACLVSDLVKSQQEHTLDIISRFQLPSKIQYGQ